MIKIVYEDGGEEPFSGDDFMRQVGESIARQLEGMTCPEHGESPTVVVRGATAESVEAAIDGCCGTFIKVAFDRIDWDEWESNA